MFSRTLYAWNTVLVRNLHLSPVLAYDFLSRCKFSTPTSTSTPLYSSINRLYAQTLCSKLFVRRASRSIYTCTTGILSRTLYAWNPVSLRSFPSFAGSRQRYLIPMQIQYSYEHTFVQQQTLCAGNPGFEIVRESVKVCTTGMSSRTLYAQHSVSLRIFPSIPGSRLRFFIAGQIQHRTMHRFLYTPAQVDAPCRLEAHYARNKQLKKCVIFLKEKPENCFAYIAQYYLLQSMKMFLHVLSRMYSSSSKFYAQNPALEIVDQQKSVNVCLHIHVKGNVQQKNPLYAASCATKNMYPRCKFSNLTSTPMYSSRLYAKNPVFEIFHEESVKVYHLHMYIGNIQQNSLFSRTL